ncbi:hypothetical protein Lalb_Chr13g0292681 [Lupinus albus]|uniref:Uncharacterized protein n=1 Tax=Lupinus albus TaxID=3870 RepID=A0A6A4PHM4_LUPAL|nr:hypothetical protein Lalb_Chr13g0292681 [Lupinus albus]
MAANKVIDHTHQEPLSPRKKMHETHSFWQGLGHMFNDIIHIPLSLVMQ